MEEQPNPRLRRIGLVPTLHGGAVGLRNFWSPHLQTSHCCCGLGSRPELCQNPQLPNTSPQFKKAGSGDGDNQGVLIMKLAEAAIMPCYELGLLAIANSCEPLLPTCHYDCFPLLSDLSAIAIAVHDHELIGNQPLHSRYPTITHHGSQQSLVLIH